MKTVSKSIFSPLTKVTSFAALTEIAKAQASKAIIATIRINFFVIRGHKGQKARSGGKVRAGFEGGQMPLVRRVPKRGFNNIFAKPLTAINLAVLNCFEDGAVVDAAALIEAGIISSCPNGLKVLSNGNLTKKITVKAAAFSASAKEKIEQAGGKAEVI